jgi:UDP-N-acetylmuramate dehydrogenase
MKISVEENILLANYTTLKVGGVADYFVEVFSVEELEESLKFAKQLPNPPLILGGGSNILVNDSGYRGVVIKNSIKGHVYSEVGNEVRLTCGAGENFDTVVADSVSKGCWGLENLSSIPGTVGATPIQNVGAYGVEISSLIVEVKAINFKTEKIKLFTNKDCCFLYRDSFFKTSQGKEWIVTEVTFCLSKKPKPILEYESLTSLKSHTDLNPKTIRNKVIEIRSAKFPDWNSVGTAGSFFKNPIITIAEFNHLQEEYPDIKGHSVDDQYMKVSLGWVLDKICNLKGFCKDGVCLYKDQALVLINESAEDASAVNDFANYIADKVKEKTGIKIEREVRSV